MSTIVAIYDDTLNAIRAIFKESHDTSEHSEIRVTQIQTEGTNNIYQIEFRNCGIFCNDILAKCTICDPGEYRFWDPIKEITEDDCFSR